MLYSSDESEVLSATGYTNYACDWTKMFSIRHFKSDRDEVWQDCSLSKSVSIDGVSFWYDAILSRWWPLRHFTKKSAAAMSAHAVSPGIYAAASASCWSIVHSYLFVKVQCPDIYILPLTGKPEQQRFTIQSGVPTSTSSRWHGQLVAVHCPNNLYKILKCVSSLQK